MNSKRTFLEASAAHGPLLVNCLRPAVRFHGLLQPQTQLPSTQAVQTNITGNTCEVLAKWKVVGMFFL